jgi:hypothetical protein
MPYLVTAVVIIALMFGVQHLGRYRGGKGPDSKGSY